MEIAILMDCLNNDIDRYGQNFWKKTLRKKTSLKIVSKRRKLERKSKYEKLMCGQAKKTKKPNQNLEMLERMYKERPMSAYVVIRKKALRHRLETDGFSSFKARAYLKRHQNHKKAELDLIQRDDLTREIYDLNVSGKNKLNKEISDVNKCFDNTNESRFIFMKV